MTPQERDLIADLFRRLDTVAEGEVDTEARAFIERQVMVRPHSVYVLVQAALVQEHALKGAEARIAELESRLAAPAPADAAPKHSFLSGLIGGEPAAPPAPPPEARPFDPWSRSAKPASPATAPAALPQAMPQAMPWGSAPAAAASQAPSFLRSAVAAAAGVAGGALLFQGIGSLLGHGGSPFAQAGAGKPAEPAAANTDFVRGTAAAEPHAGDAGYQDAAFDQDAFTDPGIDEESV